MAKGTIEVDIKGLKPTQDLHAAACNAVALLNCCPARPLPEVVTVGDAVECDLREPYPHVSRWRLRTPEASQGGTHSSPRVHLRRGHPRQYTPGKWTWVQAHAVGNKSLGVVHKDYTVGPALLVPAR